MFNFFKPKIYDEGYLPTKNGHQVFYMQAGNPNGKPVIVFHGGPGGSGKIKHAKPYNKKKYRVILFDQRGCGKSMPTGEIKNNSTQHLLDDVSRLIKHLDIKEKVILSGASWGSTMALLFAQKYPNLVDKLILSMVFLADKNNKNWEEEYSTWLYPDIWEKITNEVKGAKSVTAQYAEMINSNNLIEQVKATSLYANYERVLGCLNPSLNIQSISATQIDAAKIYINYAESKFMLEDNQIMQNVDKIKNIPTLIVHNRLDMLCPLRGAYVLHKALDNSKLVIVPNLGHYSDFLIKTLHKEIKLFLK